MLTGINIIHSPTSGDSRQGRPRGGEATEVDGDGRSWPAMTDPEGATGSRRERNSDVEVQHCGTIEMLGSLVALCDYRPTRKQENVRGRRLALGTTALMSPPMHPEDRLTGKSLDLLIKGLESCGGPESIDSSPMMAFEKRHLGRDRFLLLSLRILNFSLAHSILLDIFVVAN